MSKSSRIGRRIRTSVGLGVAGAVVGLALSAAVVVHDGSAQAYVIDGCGGWQCGTNHNQVLL